MSSNPPSFRQREGRVDSISRMRRTPKRAVMSRLRTLSMISSLKRLWAFVMLSILAVWGRTLREPGIHGSAHRWKRGKIRKNQFFQLEVFIKRQGRQRWRKECWTPGFPFSKVPVSPGENARFFRSAAPLTRVRPDGQEGPRYIPDVRGRRLGALGKIGDPFSPLPRVKLRQDPDDFFF